MDTKQKKPRGEATREPGTREKEPRKDGGKRKTAVADAPLKKRPASEKTEKAAKASAGEKTGKKETGAKRSVPLRKEDVRKKAAPAREKTSDAKAEPRKRKTQEEPAYTHGLPDSVSTKKRAYGNSKPKKKTARDMINDAVKRSGERKAEKIKKRQAKMEKGSQAKQRTQMNTPAVIYTEPAAFNRTRFLMQMITVLAVVIALVMGLSVFFKVKTITVSGAEVYSAYGIREASGIQEGDNLLTFSRARAGAKIKANLPYVKTVRFGIKLPDTVNIIVEEEDVVYAIKTDDGTWWLMTSSGRMVEQADSTKAERYTQILGVTITDPVPQERAVATESAVVQETNEQGETVPIPVSVTGAQRLNAALQIVKALEDNDIVGEATSLNVASMEYIVLEYGNRFQVNLGDSTNLAYKINCMNDVILQMQDYQTGVLDISFNIWPNQVGYTPYS